MTFAEQYPAVATDFERWGIPDDEISENGIIILRAAGMSFLEANPNTAIMGDVRVRKELNLVLIATYRLLERGETVVDGAEHLLDDAVTRVPVQRIWIGRQHGSTHLLPIRRREGGD